MYIVHMCRGEREKHAASHARIFFSAIRRGHVGPREIIKMARPAHCLGVNSAVARQIRRACFPSRIFNNMQLVLAVG